MYECDNPFKYTWWKAIRFSSLLRGHLAVGTKLRSTSSVEESGNVLFQHCHIKTGGGVGGCCEGLFPAFFLGEMITQKNGYMSDWGSPPAPALSQRPQDISQMGRVPGWSTGEGAPSMAWHLQHWSSSGWERKEPPDPDPSGCLVLTSSNLRARPVASGPASSKFGGGLGNPIPGNSRR